MVPTKITVQIGDVIYSNRGLYKHYGVYAGDGKVIHFAPMVGAEINAENAVIHETSLGNFLKGGRLEIDKSIKAKFSGAKTVERARSQIGAKGYDLIFNNCEHFARWCKSGLLESNQVDAVVNIAAEGVMYVTDLINDLTDSKEGDKLLSKLSTFFEEAPKKGQTC